MMHHPWQTSPVDTSQHKGRHDRVVTGKGFVGRLATYNYRNIDHGAGQALATFRRIEETVERR